MNKSEKKELKIYIIMFVMLLTLILFVIAIYLSMDQNNKNFIGTTSAMGTKIHQNIYGDNAEEVFKIAKESVDRLEDCISHEIDGSDIDRINMGSGSKWVKSDENIISILERTIDVSSKSRNTFDPSVLPLMSLWGMDSELIKKPSSLEISNKLDNIGYKNIKINREANRIKLENGKSLITLNQIQTGAACESIIDIYKKHQIKYGVASVGGTVGVWGNKPDQTHWKLSIKSPFAPMNDNSGIAVLKINKGYMVTYGTVEDKIDMDGQKINNLLDIRTGYPVKNNISSVVIVHSDAVIANALSKICCVLGRDESEEILNYYGAEAIFIYNDKTIYVMPNIRQYFSIVNSEYILV